METMKRRGLLKAVGAVLFGTGIAKAEDKRKVVHVKLGATPEFEAMLQKKIDEMKAESGWYKAWKEPLTTTSSDRKRHEWRLYRAIYDYDGLSYVEGNTMDAQHFKHEIPPERLSWVIGRPVVYDGGTQVIVELEGKKKNLEYVLVRIRGTQDRVGS